MRTLSVRVNEHAISGSSLGVLQGALLREVRRQARREQRVRRPWARHAAREELDIACRLARDVGCDRDAVIEAATP